MSAGVPFGAAMPNHELASKPGTVSATVGTPGGQEGLGSVLQGYSEQSNVSVVEEFINLIVAQRGYEANSKVVKAADDMYQQVNNLTQ